jgi:hypothetical protein
MISTREIEKQFQHLNQDWLDIILEIHNLVAEASPGATVEIRRYGIVYYDASRGGPVSAGICQALIKPDHIRLAFNHGAFLPDPKHLLIGETYPKRFMPLSSYDKVPWEYVKALIETSCKFDPRTLEMRAQADG